MTDELAKAAGTDPETVLFEGRQPLLPDLTSLLLTLLTAGAWLLVRYFQVLSSHYKVTTHRVVIETGVFSKTLQQLDLYRVADYTVERPFGQRILGTGNVLLKTYDKTTPTVCLHKLKTDVVDLYERIRAATEADKARRGVRVVDYEDGGPGA